MKRVGSNWKIIKIVSYPLRFAVAKFECNTCEFRLSQKELQMDLLRTEALDTIVEGY